MKRTTKTVCIAFLTALYGLAAHAQEERYFDTAESISPQLRIVVLAPSQGPIRSLLALQEEGLFPVDDIIVVGVYHKDELTNYRAARQYVARHELDWFKFHEVRGELKADALFAANPCSQDFALIFSKSDGIIFFGGADIPPHIYGEKTSLLTHLSTPFRHYIEISLAFHLLGGHQNASFTPLLEKAPSFPVLGICLGAQSLNVGAGGTMVQDIWSEKYGATSFEDVVELGRENWHTNPLARLYPQDSLFSYNLHRIRFEGGSKFIGEFGYGKGDTPYIISAHHQNMNKLGKDMVAAATSLDGKVIEALEHSRFPNVLGIQFHPDFSILWDRNATFTIAPGDEKQGVRSFFEEHHPSFEFNRKIWLWFIDRARSYHTGRS